MTSNVICDRIMTSFAIKYNTHGGLAKCFLGYCSVYNSNKFT